MANKCIKCGKVYSEDDDAVLNGCECGSIFFLRVTAPEDIERIKLLEKKLERRKTTIEKEIKEKLFDIETVRVPKDGIYEINIDALMKKKPLIIMKKNRAYFIDLSSIFEKVRPR